VYACLSGALVACSWSSQMWYWFLIYKYAAKILLQILNPTKTQHIYLDLLRSLIMSVKFQIKFISVQWDMSFKQILMKTFTELLFPRMPIACIFSTKLCHDWVRSFLYVYELITWLACIPNVDKVLKLGIFQSNFKSTFYPCNLGVIRQLLLSQNEIWQQKHTYFLEKPYRMTITGPWKIFLFCRYAGYKRKYDDFSVWHCISMWSMPLNILA